MQLRHSSILVLSFCIVLMLTSCAKSLTDIGYAEGPITTVSANNVGNRTEAIDMTQQHSNFYSQYGGPVIADNFGGDPRTNPAYHNLNMQGADQTLTQQLAIKERVKFLSKFYNSLLTDKFNAKRFQKKYLANCSEPIAEALKQHADLPCNGWSLFIAKGFKPGCELTIDYDKDEWFKISRKDSPDCFIFVQAIMPSLNNSPIITGIRYQ